MAAGLFFTFGCKNAIPQKNESSAEAYITNPLSEISCADPTLVKYKGQWYILYHRIRDHKNRLLRKLAVDRLNFDSKGNMCKVIPAGMALIN